MKPLLCIGLVLICLSAYADGFDQWRIWVGLGDTGPPYMWDTTNRLGVAPGATYDYDAGIDAVKPPLL
jgi:hypothetical protein